MSESDLQTPTHAGAVVYRKMTGAGEFLVLTARHNLDDWVLPKGHIDPGEAPIATARREVYEETGLEIDILREATTVSFAAGKEIVRTVYFLGYAAPPAEVRSSEGRRHEWLSKEHAAVKLTYSEARSALAAAAALLE